MCVLGAQKNCLVKMVLLSTHNICFGWEIRKINFCYTLLSGGQQIGEIDSPTAVGECADNV